MEVTDPDAPGRQELGNSLFLELQKHSKKKKGKDGARVGAEDETAADGELKDDDEDKEGKDGDAAAGSVLRKLPRPPFNPFSYQRKMKHSNRKLPKLSAMT
jgi:hypothetical protein